MHESVTVHIEAPPQPIWDLLSDVTKIGRYSPETFEAEWLDGAKGPAAGAKFRGHVKRNGIGPVYWTTAIVRDCVPGSSFAFGIGSSDKPLSVWGYTLEPDGSGTLVTEYFDLSPRWWLRLYWTLWGWSRGKVNRKGMRTTLERVKSEVEGAQTESKT
jgi:uncharacterized protein YndB with AHSA1/START domain